LPWICQETLEEQQYFSMNYMKTIIIKLFQFIWSCITFISNLIIVSLQTRYIMSEVKQHELLLAAIFWIFSMCPRTHYWRKGLLNCNFPSLQTIVPTISRAPKTLKDSLSYFRGLNPSSAHGCIQCLFRNAVIWPIGQPQPQPQP